MLYVIGYVGTSPKLLGFSESMDEAMVKRHCAMQDGYHAVQLVGRAVVDYLERRNLLIPST